MVLHRSAVEEQEAATNSKPLKISFEIPEINFKIRVLDLLLLSFWVLEHRCILFWSVLFEIHVIISDTPTGRLSPPAHTLWRSSPSCIQLLLFVSWQMRSYRELPLPAPVLTQPSSRHTALHCASHYSSPSCTQLCTQRSHQEGRVLCWEAGFQSGTTGCWSFSYCYSSWSHTFCL